MMAETFILNDKSIPQKKFFNPGCSFLLTNDKF